MKYEITEEELKEILKLLAQRRILRARQALQSLREAKESGN